MAVCENSGAYEGLVKFLLEWIKSVGQARFDSLLLHKVVLSYNVVCVPTAREGSRGLGAARCDRREVRILFAPPKQKCESKLIINNNAAVKGAASGVSPVRIKLDNYYRAFGVSTPQRH